MDRRTLNRRVPELLDIVGLDAKARKRKLREYSKGMARRIGLAQALIPTNIATRDVALGFRRLVASSHIDGGDLPGEIGTVPPMRPPTPTSRSAP